MKMTFLVSALVGVLSTSSAFAAADGVSMRKLEDYNRYQIRVNQTEMTLLFSTVVHTCKENLGGIGGDLKKVEVPVGTYTSIQQVVADFEIFTPLMICYTPEQDFNLSREVSFTNLPNMKIISLDIWVPSNISVSVK